MLQPTPSPNTSRTSYLIGAMLYGVVSLTAAFFVGFTHPAYAWFLFPAPLTVACLVFGYWVHKSQRQIPRVLPFYAAFVWLQTALFGAIFTYKATSTTHPFLFAFPLVLWCVGRFVRFYAWKAVLEKKGNS